MSNLSIIERLERQLSAYAAGEVPRADFVDFLSNSIAALEKAPMSMTHELRKHAEKEAAREEILRLTDDISFYSLPESERKRIMQEINNKYGV